MPQTPTTRNFGHAAGPPICSLNKVTLSVHAAGDLRFDAFRACLVGDKKLRKASYTPRVPREQNGNHTALNLSYKAAQGTCRVCQCHCRLHEWCRILQ